MTQEEKGRNEGIIATEQLVACFLKPSERAKAAAKEYGAPLDARTLKKHGLREAVGQVCDAVHRNEEKMNHLFTSLDALKAAHWVLTLADCRQSAREMSLDLGLLSDGGRAEDAPGR